MAENKKPAIPRQSSYTSPNTKKPLVDLKHNRSCSEGDRNTLRLHLHRNPLTTITNDINNNNKENVTPNTVTAMKTVYGGCEGELDVKENIVPYADAVSSCDYPKRFVDFKSSSTNSTLRLKPSSLQLCMQFNEPSYDSLSKLWNPIDSENFSSSANIWDYSDSEAAPASSWSALPNRSLLYRPLPLDIGRCTCVIVKEKLPEGVNGGFLYSLFTNEGQGRQDRKLAVAHHRRRNGRSEFIVAQNTKGILCSSDDSLIGTMTSNIMGSQYHIGDQGNRLNALNKKSKSCLAVVTFAATIATWTGNYRSMRAWIPKHQSMLLKSTSQAQHINGLPKDLEEERAKVEQLFSKVPHYNKISKQYELDFRDRGRSGLRIQSSVKNFQLTLEKNGRQTILQLGRVGKSKYVMDYRYPLTGYQAFCICLASIDSKLCCTV